MTLPTPSGQAPAPNRFERQPVIAGIVIAVLIVCLADLIAGSVIYLREQQRLVRRGLETERSYRRHHPTYHHDLRPNARVDSALWGGRFYRVRTNSLGFKDASQRAVSTASRSPRVLLIGDSFTEGVGVEFDSTFAGHLAAQAAPAGIELLNAGVASYSPLIYWRKTEELLEGRGLRFDEMILLLDISDIQDEANYYLDEAGHVQSCQPSENEVSEDSGASSMARRLKDFARTHSFGLYRAMSVVKHVLRPPLPVVPGCRPPSGRGEVICKACWTTDPATMGVYGTVGIARAREHMSRLAALLRTKRIPLAVVVYPWPHQLARNDRRSLQSSIWRGWAAEEGVRFVDLFPAFFAAVDSSSAAKVTDRYFMPGDVHWNERGGAFAEQQFLREYCRAAPIDTNRTRTALSPLCAARH